jgi:hypothetical protein
MRQNGLVDTFALWLKTHRRGQQARSSLNINGRPVEILVSFSTGLGCLAKQNTINRSACVIQSMTSFKYVLEIHLTH